MTIEQLRNVVGKRPFQAFTLHMATGRAIRVRSPEFILVPPNSRTFAVYHENAIDLIDLLLVDSIELANGRTPKRRR